MTVERPGGPSGSFRITPAGVQEGVVSGVGIKSYPAGYLLYFKRLALYNAALLDIGLNRPHDEISISSDYLAGVDAWDRGLCHGSGSLRDTPL